MSKRKAVTASKTTKKAPPKRLSRGLKDLFNSQVQPRGPLTERKVRQAAKTLIQKPAPAPTQDEHDELKALAEAMRDFQTHPAWVYLKDLASAHANKVAQTALDNAGKEGAPDASFYRGQRDGVLFLVQEVDRVIELAEVVRQQEADDKDEDLYPGPQMGSGGFSGDFGGKS